MPHTIAVAGKGGVGKTTTCGMLIDYLCKKNRGPVLVVDADANSNLNEVLGVEVETSLGAIREEMAQAELKGTIPAGMTKADFKKAGIEYTINQIDQYRACGIDGIHLYALNKFDDVAYIAKEAGLLDLI